MLKSSTVTLALLVASPVVGQQAVDLTKWKIEHMTIGGNWVLNPPAGRAEYTSFHLASRSVVYSDFNATVMRFRMGVFTASDDDIVGFVLGFQPGDSKSKNADYLLIDWKQATQSYGNWGTARAGLALSRVTGPGKIGTNGGNIDFWSHTGDVKELARGTKYGQIGWADNTEYLFEVIFTPGSVQIKVDGKMEFKLTGKFKTGRFGCYDYSQSGLRFQFPVQGTYTAIGTGCKGTAGTPVLATAQKPLIGEKFDLQVGNIPKTAPAILLFGFSKTTWAALKLPLDLAVLGMPGCTLYVSGELMFPMTNNNGTAVISINFPNVREMLLARFYNQALVVDPPTNKIGLIVSNGGEGMLGLR